MPHLEAPVAAVSICAMSWPQRRAEAPGQGHTHVAQHGLSTEHASSRVAHLQQQQQQQQQQQPM
jgi:hypothetical protein